MKLSILLFSLFSITTASAQNLNTYDQAFKKPISDRELMLQIGAVPVELTAGILSIPLVKRYLNSKELGVWKKAFPEQVTHVENATVTYKKSKKAYNAVAGDYENVSSEYVRARDGYTTQNSIQVYLGNDADGNPQYTTQYETVYHSPDPQRAAKLKPQVHAEYAKIEPQIKQLEQAEARLNSTTLTLEQEQNKLMRALKNEEITHPLYLEGQSIRKSLLRYKVLRIVGIAGSSYLILDAVARSFVLLNGDHPGKLPAYPWTKSGIERFTSWISSDSTY